MSKQKQLCSSKSFSKSPGFESLKKTFKFKTQKCKTSAQVKASLRKAPQRGRAPRLAKPPRKRAPGFDSQKAFAVVAPKVDLYFSPTRVKSLAEPYFSKSNLDASFKGDLDSMSVKNNVLTRHRRPKLHVSEHTRQEGAAALGNFKSLDQFELPTNFLDYASFNSQINAPSMDAPPALSKRCGNRPRHSDKYSFFKVYSMNKPRPCSWKKKACMFPGKKPWQAEPKARSEIRRWLGNKNKPIKCGLFQKVGFTRKGAPRRTLRCSRPKRPKRARDLGKE